MARPPDSPLIRLARTLRRRPSRPGLPGAVQRAAIALLPRPEQRSLNHSPSPLPGGDLDISRQRARLALLEARQAMSGMIGEPGATSSAHPAAVGEVPPPDLEQLRAHLEESARERDAVRQEIAGLRREIEELAQRIEKLEVQAETMTAPLDSGAADTPQVEGAGTPEPPVEAPAPSIAAPVPPAEVSDGGDECGMGVVAHGEVERAADDATVRELRERVLRALRDRVFVAGTVGTRVELAPPPTAAEMQAVLDRLQSEVLVESAEPIETTPTGTSIRVTLRTPLRWEQFGGVLERALARQFRPGEVTWSHGAVRVRGGLPRPDVPTSEGTAPGAAPDGDA